MLRATLFVATARAASAWARPLAAAPLRGLPALALPAGESRRGSRRARHAKAAGAAPPPAPSGAARPARRVAPPLPGQAATPLREELDALHARAAPRKIAEAVEAAGAAATGPDVCAAAALLLDLGRPELADTVLRAEAAEAALRATPRPALLGVVRALCRDQGQAATARWLLRRAGLFELAGRGPAGAGVGAAESEPESAAAAAAAAAFDGERVEHRLFSAVTSALFREGKAPQALETVEAWSRAAAALPAGVAPPPPNTVVGSDVAEAARADAERAAEPFHRALQAAAKAQSLKGVFSGLDAMRNAQVPWTSETHELVANAACRSVDFVTGAVSMATLPRPDRPEVLFLGRSNVGKSSLVNMVCNRKALARTSKKPGKTQQFNYFGVNDGSRWKSPGTFYLVDMPGLGYAKVPGALRDAWARLLAEYISERSSLTTIFHLVDARHGPTETDAKIMTMMTARPERVEYVVVLTKADKKGAAAVAAEALVREALAFAAATARSRGQEDEGKVPLERSPILRTSSQAKIGLIDVWLRLRKAVFDFERDPDAPAPLVGRQRGKGGGRVELVGGGEADDGTISRLSR